MADPWLDLVIQIEDAITPIITRLREDLLRILDGPDPLTRPNGHPRRTGHRHRGTRAWSRRYGR